MSWRTNKTNNHEMDEKVLPAVPPGSDMCWRPRTFFLPFYQRLAALAGRCLDWFSVNPDTHTQRHTPGSGPRLLFEPRPSGVPCRITIFCLSDSKYVDAQIIICFPPPWKKPPAPFLTPTPDVRCASECVCLWIILLRTHIHRFSLSRSSFYFFFFFFPEADQNFKCELIPQRRDVQSVLSGLLYKRQASLCWSLFAVCSSLRVKMAVWMSSCTD